MEIDKTDLQPIANEIKKITTKIFGLSDHDFSLEINRFYWFFLRFKYQDYEIKIEDCHERYDNKYYYLVSAKKILPNYEHVSIMETSFGELSAFYNNQGVNMRYSRDTVIEHLTKLKEFIDEGKFFYIYYDNHVPYCVLENNEPKKGPKQFTASVLHSIMFGEKEAKRFENIKIYYYK